jgi:hypothetical protein
LKEEKEMTKERCRAGGWTQYLKIAIANRVYAGFGELIDEARSGALGAVMVAADNEPNLMNPAACSLFRPSSFRAQECDSGYQEADQERRAIAVPWPPSP